MTELKNDKPYFDQDQFLLERDFLANPLMTGVKLARYKFAAKMLDARDIVLDLGCGNGYSSYYLSGFCSKITGVDFYADIDKCSERFCKQGNDRLSFQKADLLDPPASVLDTGYTAVTMIDVIEHFYKEDGEKILKTFTSHLPRGGMMIIGTPSKYSAAYRSQQSRDVHFHEYEPDELLDMCRSYFSRTLFFSMNDELVHTGFRKLAWFFFILGIK